VTPVRRRDLVVVAVGLALGSWFVVRAGYGLLPRLDWWLPVPLAVLAVAEALGARTLAGRLAADRARRTRPGRAPLTADARPVDARPVEPMLVARLAVLAQASAYVGAAFAGCWAGLLLHTVPALGRLTAAAGDTVTGVIGVVVGAALVAAALWLEQVCRVPPDEGEERGGAARA
jgi:hypothetical protein